MMITGIGVSRLAHIGEQPFTVFLNEHIAVARAVRRTSICGYNCCGAILNCDVRSWESDGSNVDAKLQSLVRGKKLRIHVLNSFASFEYLAVLSDVITVRQPEVSNGSCVSFMEGFYEGLGRLSNSRNLLRFRFGRLGGKIRER